MRDKFSELIAAGVASFQEKPVGTPIPCLDPMVKLYNNVWGALTDTHMSCVDGGYIITGTFVKTPYWERFKYCSAWGTTNFKLGSGFCSLEHMVWSYGYKMTADTYNNDYVIRLTLRDETAEDTAPSADCGTAVPCCPVCPCVVSLGESAIPHPFKEFFSEGQINDIVNVWTDAKGDACKIIEGLKTSRTVNADLFRVSADGQYMIVDEKLRIKLN